MTNDTLDSDDIYALERYVRDMKRKMLLGEAIARSDFVAWARQAAAWVLDKLEDAWNWVRRALGLT